MSKVLQNSENYRLSNPFQQVLITHFSRCLVDYCNKTKKGITEDTALEFLNSIEWLNYLSDAPQEKAVVQSELKTKRENTNFDKHHVTPTETILIPHRQHEEIHGNVPVISELNLKMRQYDKLVQLSVMLKNWKTSYEKEFGNNPIDIGLEQILKKKKELLKDVKVLIKDDLKKVKHIKGLGVRYLAGLLAYTHPNRFRNLHRFLLYCGYKGSNLKYNRKIKSLIHQVVINLIMHKDKHYYPLYLKIKNDLNTRFPIYTKGKIDGMTKNRVGTFLLKEVYQIFRDG